MDVLYEEADGLIIPGGWYGDTRSELLQLINNMNVKRKLLAAICGSGTVFLAKAGILKNSSTLLRLHHGHKGMLKYLGKRILFREKTLFGIELFDAKMS